jgi:hypothetical protein
MPDRFTVQHREVGMLRIYLKPSDKVGPRRFRGAKPFYRELIRTAKADGIINAVAQNMHYGFSNRGPAAFNRSDPES